MQRRLSHPLTNGSTNSRPKSRGQRGGSSPLRSILGKLGEAGIPEEDIPKRLDAKADELLKLRAEIKELRRGPPTLASIAEEAQNLINKGELDAARDALNRGRETARAV
jgi:soluble cytochrome b562